MALHLSLEDVLEAGEIPESCAGESFGIEDAEGLNFKLNKKPKDRKRDPSRQFLLNNNDPARLSNSRISNVNQPRMCDVINFGLFIKFYFFIYGDY